MKKINYSLEQINEKDRTFFYEMLPYVSEYIISINRNNELLEIVTEESKVDLVSNKIKFLEKTIKSNDIGQAINSETKVIFDRKDIETINKESVYDELIKNGHVIEISEGVFCYGGIFLKVFEYFSKKIKEFAHEVFPDVKEYSVPTLFPIDKFAEGGYFETFPHHIMFQTLMKNDIEVLDKFAKNGVGDSTIFNNMQLPKQILRNAACVPVYPILENTVMNDSDKPVSYLVYGRCFRNEASNVLQLARLNEFNMSELVFIGSSEAVKNCIEKSRKLWDFWMDKFNFNCEIETANDSFFASNYKKLKLFQILGDSKQELRLLVPGLNDYIASSSINFHRTHFTKKYNIRLNDGYCHSSCIAFGLERLSFAFLSQNGLNPEKWTEETHNELKKYVEV